MRRPPALIRPTCVGHLLPEEERDSRYSAQPLSSRRATRFDHRHAVGAIVEAWDRGEMLTACLAEIARVLDADFLQRLEAVRGEAGSEDRHALDAR